MATGLITSIIILLLLIAVAVSLFFAVHFQNSEKHPPGLPNPPFPQPMAPNKPKPLAPDKPKLKHGFVYDATVSLTRPGAYRTVTEAIAAAPSLSRRRYFIHIEAGVYVENVYVGKEKTNIAFIGDGAEVTKITMNKKYPEFQTSDTTTVVVEGNGFMAQFITFENSAGDETQAVALMNTSDKSSFFRCTFLGFQDTLYAEKFKQFYRECDIYGTVDFIFGKASAVFQRCNLYARSKNHPITFTAQGREVLDNSGFVIHNCSLTVAPELQSNKAMVQAYLGRPWFELSKVIVMQSFLDSIIDPAGWLEWSGKSTDKLIYREYNNWGPGIATEARVKWLGFKVLNDAEEAQQYTVSEFIDGDSWIPETQIPYASGLLSSDLRISWKIVAKYLW